MLAKLTQAALYANSKVKEHFKTGPSIIEPNYGYPGDKCCTVYRDGSFSSDSKTFCHNGGSYTNINFSEQGFNDTMSSWHCGKKISYKFCHDVSHSGDCETDGN